MFRGSSPVRRRRFLLSSKRPPSLLFYILYSGPGSSVGIATAYGLDGRGIESQWGRDFPHLSRPTLGPTKPPVQWVTRSFPGVSCGRGVTLTPHPLLVPRSKIEYSYTSTLPKGLCGLRKGETYLNVKPRIFTNVSGSTHS